MKKQYLTALLFVWMALSARFSTANVLVTFGPGDYDNTANTVTAGPTTNYNQTTGKFRDVIWWSINNGQPRVGSGDYINWDNSLKLGGNPSLPISAAPGPGPHKALNFTGPSISGGQNYLAIYDTTPADGAVTQDLFEAAQGLIVSADVLFVNHSVSGGVVALYDEGQDGLALLASNGGGNNPDVPKVSLVWQSVGMGITLTSTNLPGNTFVQERWYRVTMDLSVSGDTWTMVGTFHKHVIETDPTSALGALITTLNYSGSLSDPDTSARVLTNPGEVGIMARGNQSISLPDNVGFSATNFAVIPEPGTVMMVAMGGLMMLRRRSRN